MNNILVAGNGFDLAHGLFTNYRDFLFVMKKWTTIYVKYKTVRNGGTISQEDFAYKYLVHARNMDDNNIEKLDSIIARNSWVNYYCKCEAEIDLWIDFEREIIPVKNFLETIFCSKYLTNKNDEGLGVAYMSRDQLSLDMIRTLELWDKYFASSGNHITIKAPYVSHKYGILKKSILKDLREEFDQFIEAFELYLCEFVNKRNDVKIIEQINNIGITHVISFNYTSTELLYGVSEENTHHIHGKVRKDPSTGKNNMVVGVNEQENQNMDFIYFVKYFQRIQKGSGVKYKTFVDKTHKNSLGQNIRDPYNLYIYGHSLDETDADILRYLIGDGLDVDSFIMKAKKVILFYYNDEDYAQKVINLIKLYGRPIVEAYIEKGLFEFVKTDD